MNLAGRLIPAVPVPFDASGVVHEAGLEAYAAWMAKQPVGGVAVWAHTGRGLRLPDDVRERVLRTWRGVLPAGSLLIAAAGARPGLQAGRELIASAQEMACRAAEWGADALLVYPPVAFRDRPDRDQLILHYHSKIAETGLPILVFYLYEAAGGISYHPKVLGELLAHPQVLGIKIATLDSVMTFQDIAHLVRTSAPGKLIVTGEDRFLGYSLMCGAQTALIGMAAACTRWQAELLRSYQAGRFQQFLAWSEAIDAFARTTFCTPIEGYIQRMLWCLVHERVIPMEAAHDPWGPPLDPTEFNRIGECINGIVASCELLVASS